MLRPARSLLSHSRRSPAPALAMVVVLSATVAPSLPAGAQTSGARVHTVTSPGDAEDAAIGDGRCRTAWNVCTLRAAISEANASSGPDRIEFAIPGPAPATVRPRSPYRPLADPAGGTTIDGTTQPRGDLPAGRPAIDLAGPGADASGVFDLLHLRSAGNVVRGLAVHGFRKQITIEGPAATGNRILGNVIGTDGTGAGGETVQTALAHGVTIRDGATGNTVGGGTGEGNVISGNGQHGVAIFGEGTSGNVVTGNTIGPSPASGPYIGNRHSGVVISSSASGNRVGRSGSEQAGAPSNLIAGNDAAEVLITGGPGTADNVLRGNEIGIAQGDDFGPASPTRGWALRIENRSLRTLVAENLIAGGHRDGTLRLSGGTKHNRVTGNDIGGWGSIPWSHGGNTGVGVRLEQGAYGNELADNLIVYHGTQPIELVGAQTNNNSLRRNRMVDNGVRGRGVDATHIDLEPLGVRNEAMTPATPLGPNKQLGAPVIESVGRDGVTGRACGGCVIELFAGTEAPYVYIATATVVDGRFRFDIDATRINHDTVMVTATDSVGNTSELSELAWTEP